MEKQNLQKGSSGIQTVGSVLKVIGSWIYRLRKVLRIFLSNKSIFSIFISDLNVFYSILL